MKNKGKQKLRNRSSSETPSSIVSASVFGASVGILTAIILLIVSTFICFSSDDPDAFTAPLGIFCSAVAYFICGFAASRKRRAALPCGILSGAMVTAIFILISLFLNNELSMGLSLPVSLLIRISFVAVSLVGALLGTNVSLKKKRRR